jgi:hypothetical protein
MRTVAALALALALVLAVAACGADDESTTAPTTNPTASAPDATAPPADATQPGTTAVTPPPAQTQTEPGGATSPQHADDEQSVRVPASFVVVAGGRLDPPQITVPPFLAVEVSVRSDDGRPHRVELRTPEPQTLDVPAGGRAAVRIGGLRAGTYAVLLDGRDAGAIAVGGEVGP